MDLPHAINFQREVDRLIGDMKAAALASHQPELERMTTEIATQVMVSSIPNIDDQSLLSCYAQTAIIRAWRRYAEATLPRTL